MRKTAAAVRGALFLLAHYCMGVWGATCQRTSPDLALVNRCAVHSLSTPAPGFRVQRARRLVPVCPSKRRVPSSRRSIPAHRVSSCLTGGRVFMPSPNCVQRCVPPSTLTSHYLHSPCHAHSLTSPFFVSHRLPRLASSPSPSQYHLAAQLPFFHPVNPFVTLSSHIS